MALHRAVFCLAALILIGLPASSEGRPLSGSESPDFSAAVADWLEGEDLAALQHLAKLARDGNAAAQILLARIAERGNTHVHVTSRLSREERVALLRIPGGLSGRSWLSVAQDAEPVATALLQSSKIGEKAPAIAALLEFGEPTTALLAAQSMLFQGEAEELIQVLQGLDDRLPAEAAPLLIWAMSQAAGVGGGRYGGSARVSQLPHAVPGRRAMAAELAWIGPDPGDIVDDDALRSDVLSLFRRVHSWTPMVNFCEAHCADSVPACTAVGGSAMAYAGPFAMRSPLESVISNDVYWASPRVEGDLARKIEDVAVWRGYPAFRALNTCFFDAMEATQDRHGHAP